MSTFVYLFAGIGLLVGMGLGAGFYRVYLKRQEKTKLRLPNKWPLTARVLVTHEEHKVFNWLTGVFPDHLVMIKLPVLRFTVPASKAESESSARWQEVLASVYCTLTVCTADGNVLGCVDVPGKRGLNRHNRQVKESLLSDCRIAYTVVTSARLPEAGAMRAAFLGELQPSEQAEIEATRGGDSNFEADLHSFTKEKRNAAKAAALKALNAGQAAKTTPALQPAGFNPDGTGAFDAGRSGKFHSPWQDSFSHADESRPAKLN